MFRRSMIRSLHHRSWLTLLLVVPAGVAYAGAISIDVVDAVTTRPLAGVTVTAESRSGESRIVTTGSDGSAYFEDLADGFYEFTTPADPKAKRKDRWLFQPTEGELVGIAGIWRDHPEVGEAFTVVAQPEFARDTFDNTLSQEILFQSGGPVLFMPYTFKGAFQAKRVGIAMQIEKKGVIDLVTETDREIERGDGIR